MQQAQRLADQSAELNIYTKARRAVRAAYEAALEERTHARAACAFALRARYILTAHFAAEAARRKRMAAHGGATETSP
jgi:hypothetical protein